MLLSVCAFIIVNISVYPTTEFDCRVAKNANIRCGALYGTRLSRLIKKDKQDYNALCVNRRAK